MHKRDSIFVDLYKIFDEFYYEYENRNDKEQQQQEDYNNNIYYNIDYNSLTPVNEKRNRIHLGTKALISTPPNCYSKSSLDEDEEDDYSSIDDLEPLPDLGRKMITRTVVNSKLLPNGGGMTDSMILQKASDSYLNAFSRQVSKLKRLSDNVVSNGKPPKPKRKTENFKRLLRLLLADQQQGVTTMRSK